MHDSIKLAEDYIKDYPQLKDQRDNLIDLFDQFAEKPVWAGISCSSGWWQILHMGHQAIKFIYPEYKIVQIKEKFGGLRFYINKYPPQNTWQRYAVIAIINIMERDSFKICELCGEDSYSAVHVRTEHGWHHTYCDSCEIEYLQKKYPGMYEDEIIVLQKAVLKTQELKNTMKEILEQ